MAANFVYLHSQVHIQKTSPESLSVKHCQNLHYIAPITCWNIKKKILLLFCGTFMSVFVYIVFFSTNEYKPITCFLPKHFDVSTWGKFHATRCWCGMNYFAVSIDLVITLKPYAIWIKVISEKYNTFKKLAMRIKKSLSWLHFNVMCKYVDDFLKICLKSRNPLATFCSLMVTILLIKNIPGILSMHTNFGFDQDWVNLLNSAKITVILRYLR